MADVEKGGHPTTVSPNESTPTTQPPQYSDDPPPSYDSVVGKIQGIKDTSPNNAALAKNLCMYVFCSTVGSALTIFFSIVIPIMDITVGSLYLDDCPRRRMIPIYLIVLGVFLLVKAFVSIGEICYKRKNDIKDGDPNYQRPRIVNFFDGPVGCFLFGWFIAGNIWVFGIHKDYQGKDPAVPKYCHSTLYLYAFWMLIIFYIIAAANLLLCCFVGLIACCCGSKK